MQSIQREPAVSCFKWPLLKVSLPGKKQKSIYRDPHKSNQQLGCGNFLQNLDSVHYVFHTYFVSDIMRGTRHIKVSETCSLSSRRSQSTSIQSRVQSLMRIWGRSWATLLEAKDRVNNMVMLMERKGKRKKQGSYGDGKPTEITPKHSNSMMSGKLLLTPIRDRWGAEHGSGRWCSDYGRSSMSCTEI